MMLAYAGESGQSVEDCLCHIFVLVQRTKEDETRTLEGAKIKESLGAFKACQLSITAVTLTESDGCHLDIHLIVPGTVHQEAMIMH